jgi:CHAT domain
VVLTSQVSWMADLPWEFLYDPGRKTFLAASEVNFTRNVITAIPAERGKSLHRKMRILVIVAQPLGLGRLSVEAETEVIKSGFQDLIDANVAEVDVLLDATPARLHRRLEAVDYDIVHFIGHGGYDRNTDTGSLVFESGDEAESNQLDADVLQQIVCRRGIRLVFLNACETGRGGVVNFNSGVAPALVAGGVPAVVANQFSVLDVSATTFARHFYWALGCGHSLGDAAREARVAVNYSISGEAIDWAVPVVFARNPCAGIGIKKEPARLERDVATRAPLGVRRRATNRPQVALWDVQRLMPKLGEIAETLTRAQEKFEFRAVRFTAPLGTWRIEKAEGQGKAYLMAEDVARRLENKPREFGADRLIAIANLPLRSARKEELQVWDRSPGRRITIISIYGYLRNSTPEFTIERLISNLVTAGLVNLENHKNGLKTCLMYDNPPGDLSLGGRLSLCDQCKKRLRSRGEDFQWIEALLAAYP